MGSDLILGHSGWGETLLLHQVWPQCPSVVWPELWVQPHHAGIELPPHGPGPTLQQLADHSARNHLTRAAFCLGEGMVCLLVIKQRVCQRNSETRACMLFMKELTVMSLVLVKMLNIT